MAMANMTRRTHLGVVVGFVVSLTLAWPHTPMVASQATALPELLTLAGEYHTSYVTRVSGATLEEQYQLIDVTGGRMSSAVRISSDVVFVNLNGGVTALRDSYAVDSRALRERAPRITALLAPPATPTFSDWEKVISYPAQAAHLFVMDLILKLNEPTMALRFFAPDIQPSLTYKLDGKRQINGVQTLGVRFDEPQALEKKYVLGTRGNGRAMGRLWIDAASGAIHETELWVESKAESATIKVKYAPAPALGLVLPTETTETYEEREAASGPRTMDRNIESGRAGSRVSFQATAKYSKPTHTPIDLRTIRPQR
jgi:hypothetical protein